MESILKLIIFPLNCQNESTIKSSTFRTSSHKFTKHYVNHPIIAEAILEHRLMYAELFQTPSPLLT